MERYRGSESKLLLGMSSTSGGRDGDGRGGHEMGGETSLQGEGSLVPLLLSQEHVSFFVVSGLRGGQARRMACDESTQHLKLVPFGAVAACVNGDGIGAQTLSIAAFPPLAGQAFCFLPLPVHTQVTPPFTFTPFLPPTSKTSLLMLH